MGVILDWLSNATGAGKAADDWWKKNQWWVYLIVVLIVIFVVAYAYGKFTGGR